ncbi:MAG: MoxR family ATPase [Planctomycetota bacterium]
MIQSSNITPLPIGPRVIGVLSVAYRAMRPVLLEGPTGVGKSEIVQQVTRELGIGFEVLDLSLMEPPDLLGLPRFEDGRTRYALPSLLPVGGRGIMLLEELNRAAPAIRQPALQLLSARRLHEYELPPGWCPFAAINPEGEDYEVVPLDPALRARFLNLRVSADRVSWLKWAQQAKIHSAVQALVRLHDDAFESVPPRTWKYVSDVLQALQPKELASRTLLQDLVGGYLPGPWIGHLVEALAKGVDDPSLDLLAALRSRSHVQDAVLALRRYREGGQTDRLHQVTRQLSAIVTGPQVEQLAARHEFNLEAFEDLLGELPGDHRETVQYNFALNPGAVTLVDLGLAVVVENYVGDARKKVMNWLRTEARRYRAWTIACQLPSYLRSRIDIAELKTNRRSIFNLDRFAQDVGPPFGKDLRAELDKMGFPPFVATR